MLVTVNNNRFVFRLCFSYRKKRGSKPRQPKRASCRAGSIGKALDKLPTLGSFKSCLISTKNCDRSRIF